MSVAAYICVSFDRKVIYSRFFIYVHIMVYIGGFAQRNLHNIYVLVSHIIEHTLLKPLYEYEY